MNLRTLAVCVLVLAIAGFAVAPAGAQSTEYQMGLVWGEAKAAFPSSTTAMVTSYRYGPVIDCQEFPAMDIVYLASNQGATTKTAHFIEWLWDNPAQPDASGVYAGITYTAGYALPSGNPSFREPLFMWKDATTTGVAIVIADGAYRAEVTTKAPYCRYVVYNYVADGGIISTSEAWYVPRYAAWPALDPLSSSYQGTPERDGTQW